MMRGVVARALERCPLRGVPVVACSGGPDSLALLFVVHALRSDTVAAIVDHGLQPGSGERSSALASALHARGIAAEVHPVVVSGGGGMEAAARRARYAALRAVRPGSPVLLGHTLDDQAETVLLGLGRGSGARSIAGMREWDEPWLRPLLGLRRSVVHAACSDHSGDLEPWSDPHNVDPRFTRVRLRHEVLPLVEDVLPGATEALARTAAQLREDDEALSAWASHVRVEAGDPLSVAVLGTAPAAVRRRVLRDWLVEAGATALTDAHLRSADALVGEWRGQGGPRLPGGLDVVRRDGRLSVQRFGQREVHPCTTGTSRPC
jgi:tRNA(Ile)-lysidine synthase